ncbi:Thioredoxin-like protein 1 [Extremus antarcticus]|uniref:Thioredoxin-like protein 1 n=1 Tax=Extremus antarcticus TaxID=702011 RepID=A0AAJ0DFY2_9PEZI|nr:Thioredoxin-like protein 1 [Extremus antarcticus]
MSKTITITSPHHFTTILQSSRIVVADFWADWCGPCKTIAPLYEQLSAQLSRPDLITFTKVDTDTQKEIAQTYNISAMPTFLIFKGGREFKRIRGADPKALDAAVKSLAQEAAKAGEESANAAAEGSSGGGWAAFGAPRGMEDVTGSVDLLGLDFLNLDGEKGDKRGVIEGGKPSALSGGAASGKKDWIESDTDEQLMLFVPFQTALKLHSIHITSIPGEGDEEVMRPKTLQLFTNRSTVLGFDEAEDTPVTQKIEIKPNDWDAKTGTAKVELRYVKFQNISSLVLFVADGEGEGEKTRIDRIRFYGEAGQKMGKLEKFGDEQGE